MILPLKAFSFLCLSEINFLCSSSTLCFQFICFGSAFSRFGSERAMSLPSVDKKPRARNPKVDNSAFSMRVQTLMRKSHELSALCDVPVVFLSYGPGGSFHRWPENPYEIQKLTTFYQGLSDEARNKHSSDVEGFLMSENNKIHHPKKKPKLATTAEIDTAQISGLATDELWASLSELAELEEKLEHLSQSFVDRAEEEKEIDELICVMDGWKECEGEMGHTEDDSGCYLQVDHGAGRIDQIGNNLATTGRFDGDFEGFMELERIESGVGRIQESGSEETNSGNDIFEGLGELSCGFRFEESFNVFADFDSRGLEFFPDFLGFYKRD